MKSLYLFLLVGLAAVDLLIVREVMPLIWAPSTSAKLLATLFLALLLALNYFIVRVLWATIKRHRS